MLGNYINLITEVMVGVFITITVLFFTIGKLKNVGFIINNTDLVAVSINWVIILPLIINFFMFSFANMVKSFSSIERIFLNIKDGKEERSFDKPEP